MMTRLIVIAFLGACILGCTSTGAPRPGERVSQIQCEVNERYVCTGITGSRLKKETGFCSCSLVDNIHQF